MTTTAVSKYDDVIDVRDIIARVEELESELTDAKDGRSEQEAEQDLQEWCEAVNEEEEFPLAETLTEYLQLSAFLEELKGNGGDEQWRGDWYPVTLVRDSYFKDYAEELADDIGAIDRNATWPCNCIDWDQAARELKMDYSTVEFDGVTYCYR